MKPSRHRPGSGLTAARAEDGRGIRALIVALSITTLFCIGEALGGYWTHSLALLADAGHMLSDVASLALALLAAKFAMRPATPGKTYGYYRAEILAALVNGVTLVFVAGYVFYEGLRRLRRPPEIDVLPMLALAAAGLLANLVVASVLARSREHSLNLQGAFLHVVGDALGSLGAVMAGLIMYATELYVADPIISMLIGVLVLVSSWRLLRESVNVLMEGVPARIDIGVIEAAMKRVPGVAQVHDLHVWTVTSGFDAMSAHVVLEDNPPREETQRILDALHEVAHREFDIEHTTFQLEERRLFQLRRDKTPPPE